MKKSILLAILLTLLCFSHVYSQLHSISGQLQNGLGTVEKLDRVRIRFYNEDEVIGSVYSDSAGYFNFTQFVNVAESPEIPEQFQLSENYPNPFHGNTNISYVLHKTGDINISVYNILGQKVRTLQHGRQISGTYSLTWDGKDEFSDNCSIGTYFLVVRVNEATHVKKMCLMGTQDIQFYNSSSYGDLLAKQYSQTDLTVEISDRDLVDTTFKVTYDTNDRDLNLGQILVHVYPFVRSESHTRSAMTGESVTDTIDVYHENPIELSSQDAEVDYSFIDESHIEYTIGSVYTNTIYIRINEIGSSRVSYYLLKLELDPRLKMSKQRFKRGYMNIPYEDLAFIQNNRGTAQITLITDPPDELLYENYKLSGNPTELYDDYLYFELIDDREIFVLDSIYLSIREPYNIDFNEYTIDVLEEYPRDGTHPYSWVNTYTGVTQNLYYKGEIIANANPDGSKSCYCCGLTFENFFRSIQRLLSNLGRVEDVNSMTVADMKYFLHLWFVQKTWGDGPGVALERYGLGDVIKNRADVKSGDYLQFWRTTGSGHSVIFIDWMVNTNEDTMGIRYWSTQGSTNGINYNIEYFDGFGGTVDPDIMYFSRVRSPEDFETYNRTMFENYEKVIAKDFKIVPKSFMKN